MKKSYLMIAAAAMVMASCAENYELKNDLKDGDNNQTKISFASFAEKATRASQSNNLEFYHNTFAAYSTKKANEGGLISTVFDGTDKDIVTYIASAEAPNDWTYAPYRYWDKQAVYEFAAVAPNSHSIKFAVSADAMLASGDFVGTYTLNGFNLQQATPGSEQLYIGFASGDIDIMTASVKPQDGKNHDAEVNLIFKHILSKLNVAVKKGSNFSSSDVVKVTNLEITKLANTGTYAESAYTTNASGDVLISGWSAVSGDLTLSYANASGDVVPASGDGNYYMEALVMPQEIASGDAAEKLILSYEITTTKSTASGDVTNTEKFTYKMGLAEAFEDLYDRHNYTIKFTINPDVIMFDAGVDTWADETYSATVY